MTEATQLIHEGQMDITPISGNESLQTVSLPQQEQNVLEIIQAGHDGDPQETIQKLAESESHEPQVLSDREDAYISKNPKFQGLEVRYSEDSTEYSHLHDQITQFAQERGLQRSEIDGLKGQEFSSGNIEQVRREVHMHIERLFNSDQGSKNPEKQRMVDEETDRYLDLLLQAQSEEGGIQKIDAQTSLDMVRENVWTLAYQDRAASENLLGDHGIRHIVGYNIRVCEQIFDQLEAQGQHVSATDRLMAHQIMIDHDLGYATDTVRNSVNSGKFGDDRGHNLLSAKYLRQANEDPNSPIARIFQSDQISLIHRGILEHDSSDLSFSTADNSSTARSENLLSAVHLADNTHAFEDKLPELLYSYPESLAIMRLLKTAGEIGDTTKVQELKARLKEEITVNESFSQDDKEALSRAADSIGEGSYKFAVGRICGNKPEFTIDQSGKVHISVDESAIHQEVVQTFDIQSYDQLKKFIADLGGIDKSQVNLDQDSIDFDKVSIQVRKSGEHTDELSDYDRRVGEIVRDPKLQEFILGGESTDFVGDSELAKAQKMLTVTRDRHEKDSPQAQQLDEQIEAIKRRRLILLNNYLS